MDKRKELNKGYILEFPGMSIMIKSEIGRGSNAIVYEGEYPDMNQKEMHRVLVKELFPYHPDGWISRNNDGTIVCEVEAQEYFDFHKHSFEYGNRIHLELLRKFPNDTGGNVNTFSQNGTLYTVLAYNGSRNLEKRCA